ncbi:MAG: hypothetical protein V2J24_23565, partial [Pseudomonadales bacterium]|nr:hypothetical protein [Pseudomonadales bacterium]
MRRALFIVALLLPAVAWLLWPLPTASRWDLRGDPERVAARAAWLAAVDGAAVERLNVVLIVADDLSRHDV